MIEAHPGRGRAAGCAGRVAGRCAVRLRAWRWGMYRWMTRGAAPVARAVGSAVLVSFLLAMPASASGKDAFGFQGSVSGFPTGAVTLSGGGAYDLATGFVKAAGGFRCTED